MSETNCSVHETCMWELALGGAKRNAETAIHRMEKAESELTKLRKRVEVLEKALEKYALPQTRLTKKHEEEQWRLEPGFHDPQTAVEALKESAKIAGE